jgi:hypothetical protein
MQDAIVLIGDKNSMEDRPTWAWKQHWISCARSLDVPDDATPVERAELAAKQPFVLEVYEKCYGGIPIFSSYGDCHQLLPVGMKAISDPALDCSSVSSLALLVASLSIIFSTHHRTVSLASLL